MTTVPTPAAGKLIPRGDGAKECLVLPEEPKIPELIKRLRQKTQPDVGERRTFYSSSCDPNMRFGINTKPSDDAKTLVNTSPKTLFQQRLTDLKENVYALKSKAPLGCTQIQSKGLPSFIDPLKHEFGVKTIKGDSAGLLISPPKTTDEVETESRLGKELYKISHYEYDVGEMVDRNYDWSKFTRDTRYGVSTPHDNSGSAVHSAMNWKQDRELVSKQVDDFRERTQPQLGQVHDPISDTLTVNSDHTFGVMVEPDQFSAGELLHMTGPSTYLQCCEFDSGVLSSIRQHLKNNSFTNFESLRDALHKSSCEELVEKTKVRDILFEFRVPLEPEMIELILIWCTSDKGTVAYNDLVDFLNWMEEVDQELISKVKGIDKDMMTDLDPQNIVLQNTYRTSSQQIKTISGAIPTNNYRSYGVPTIRSDRPAPYIRRVGDSTNYGDESDAYGLMYPSIYSALGVYEKDFFIPRSPEQIREIFTAMGLNMNDNVFKTVWEQAASRDPNGQVCVESFRVLLEEIQTKNNKN